MKRLLGLLIVSALFISCNITVGDYCYGPVGVFHGEKNMIDNSCGSIAPESDAMIEFNVTSASEFLVCRDYLLYDYEDLEFLGDGVCTTRFRGILTTTERGYFVYERYILDCSSIHCTATYETELPERY